MKQIYILLAFCISFTGFSQTTDLLISKYGEGSSNNKFIEIYNGTGAPVNLDNYAFATTSNGATGDYEFWTKFNAGAVIANGDVYVIAHGQSDPIILAAADQLNNFLSNGDDGFALVLDNGTFVDADMDGNVDAGEMTGFTILDFLGDFGPDPGTGWAVSGVNNATANNTLTRKSTVCGPNNNWDSSRGFDATTMITTAMASEWIVTGIDTGWGDLGTFVGCTTTPVLTITAPANGSALNSGTTTTNITWSAQNAPAGATYRVSVNGTVTNNATSPFSTMVQDGGSYTVIVTMLNGTTTVTSDTVSFTVAFPCDLQIGTITTTCQANTSGVDLYNITIDYTGGSTSTYTIDTAGNGTVGGDNPSTTAAGQITINGVAEGTNFTITFTGSAANSSCNFTRSITSPSCVGNVTCANPGDIIITEIMQNPNAVGDNVGEYFEIYNTTAAAINMQGWVIKDDVTASEMHVISNLIVPANGYAVLGLNNDTAVNGGMVVNYVYPSVISLGNGVDGLIIECSGTIIDQVIYDDGATFPDGTGASMELAISKYNATDNDLGVNWGLGTATYGAGDLGTPGSVNTFTLSNDDFALQNFKMYPNPLTNGQLNIATGNGNPVDAVFYTMLGQEVLTVKGSTQNIDASALNAGVYVVKITQGTSVISRKLIVE